MSEIAPVRNRWRATLLTVAALALYGPHFLLHAEGGLATRDTSAGTEFEDLTHQLEALQAELNSVTADGVTLATKKDYVARVLALREQIAVRENALASAPKACEIQALPLLNSGSPVVVFRIEDDPPYLYIAAEGGEPPSGAGRARRLQRFAKLSAALAYAKRQDCAAATAVAAAPADPCAGGEPGIEARLAEARGMISRCDHGAAQALLQSLRTQSQCRATRQTIAREEATLSASMDKDVEMRGRFERALALHGEGAQAYKAGQLERAAIKLRSARDKLHAALGAINCPMQEQPLRDALARLESDLAVVANQLVAEPAPPAAQATRPPIDCPAGSSPEFDDKKSKWGCDCADRADGEPLFFHDESGRCVTFGELTKDSWKAISRALDKTKDVGKPVQVPHEYGKGPRDPRLNTR